LQLFYTSYLVFGIFDIKFHFLILIEYRDGKLTGLGKIARDWHSRRFNTERTPAKELRLIQLLDPKTTKKDKKAINVPMLELNQGFAKLLMDF